MIDATTPRNSTPHVSVKGYLTGFILSIILTAIPFAMVMGNMLPRNALYATVIVCAVVQIIVHLVYFLHLDTKTEGGWNMVAFVFAVIIILIVVVGSLWIMWNLNYNMMPG